MHRGWIPLYRKSVDNPLYFSEPFTRWQAWQDMILMANFKSSSFYSRGISIGVDRGQLAYSEVSLAERWQWSRSKVRRFLSRLETEHQITQQKNNLTTLITIINYDIYNDPIHQTIQQKDSKRYSKRTPDDTADDTHTNKDNKVNNENNDNKKERRTSELVLQEYLSNMPEHKFDESVTDALVKWIQYRRDQRYTLGASFVANQAKKLNGLPSETVIAAIQNSIDNGWQGLFPDKVKREITPSEHIDMVMKQLKERTEVGK